MIGPPFKNEPGKEGETREWNGAIWYFCNGSHDEGHWVEDHQPEDCPHKKLRSSDDVRSGDETPLISTSSSEGEQESREASDGPTKSIFAQALGALPKTVVGIGGTLCAVGVTATLVGFAPAGIVAGSVAAGMQSAIGNVAVGSAFATAQSLGATGVFSSMIWGGGAAAVAGVVVDRNKGGGDGDENDGSDEGRNLKTKKRVDEGIGSTSAAAQ
jgi:hypothetical protein